MKTFLGITGTTCVGKSAVAVELAKMLHTEIISADSMQIYKGMDIGTAKITAAEMCGVKHHMLDIVEPNKMFSSFEYQEQAAPLIEKIPLPLVVGGTGFYFDSLLYPPEFGQADKQYRAKLQEILKTQGLEKLQQMLLSLDEKTFNAIDVSNPMRVIRALEIAENGQRRSEGNGKRTPKYNCRLYVLQRDRESLYQLIDKRVDTMIECGLVEEVSSLVNKYGVCDTSAFSAIGYKEIIAYLQNEITLEEAVAQIKLNTRHYAKRQITYFKKMNVTKFIDVDELSANQIAENIFQELAEMGLV